jgi:hypothetical protein
MLLRELLFETISTSRYFPEIHQELSKLIYKKQDIIGYLKGKIQEISGVDVDVKIKSLPNGDGAYVHGDNTLYINKPVIKTISDNLTKLSTATGGKETLKHNLNDSINRLTSIVVHELTHVIQISKSGKPYEKSLVHNKQTVDKALTHLGLKSKKQRAAYQGDKEDLNLKRLNVYLARLGDPTSEINKAVDRAQPEEISAYANQSASEIIAKLKDHDKSFKRSELRRIIKQLKSSHSNLTKSIEDYKMVKNYSKKAHDKFFKLLYIELMDYYDNIR